MKKFFCLILVLLSLSLVISTTAVAEDDLGELVETLHQGIIPLEVVESYEDLLSFMQIVDESEERLLTSKLETFFTYISYYYYESLTHQEIFERFKAQNDKIDINNMDETYKALFKCLDRFSYYLTPEEAHKFFNPTEARGIGIKMVWHDETEDSVEGIYVEEVALGSPASKAGILVGDRIVSYDSQSVEGLGFQALVALSAGITDEDETLSLELERNGEVFSYTLPREAVSFREYSVTLYPEKNLIYLTITSFMNDSTASEIALELDTAYQLGYRNIIVDLQDNSGGDVYLCAEILSKFTPKRELLFTMGRNNNKNAIAFYSLGNGYHFDSVSVLVNEVTASSAEIFTKCLQVMTDALVFGRQTYGKGVAQYAFKFTDGAACGITAYVSYDALGNTYNEKGIKPDTVSKNHITKNSLPKGTPAVTGLNYHSAVSGADNNIVRGVEIRLEALGFLANGRVDTLWDDATTRALMAFQTAYSLEVTGELDFDTAITLIRAAVAWENTPVHVSRLFDYAYNFVR